MTFDQFFASKDKLAIYCSGLEEMMTICMMYKERGYDKYNELADGLANTAYESRTKEALLKQYK